MTTIGPGTPLICVDDTYNGPWRPKGGIVNGALYFCERVESRLKPCPRDGCYTVIRLPGKRWKFCPERFRPLNDGDTSLVDEANRQRQVEKIKAHAFQYSSKPMKEPA